MHGLGCSARLPGPQADLPARPQGFKALKQTALKKTCEEPSNGRAGGQAGQAGQAGRRAGGQAGRRAHSKEQFSGSLFGSFHTISEQFFSAVFAEKCHVLVWVAKPCPEKHQKNC